VCAGARVARWVCKKTHKMYLAQAIFAKVDAWP
jgi:hypothetical protein